MAQSGNKTHPLRVRHTNNRQPVVSRVYAGT
jgi:hypothetical protein